VSRFLVLLKAHRKKYEKSQRNSKFAS